jgi:hypothetical protein
MGKAFWRTIKAPLTLENAVVGLAWYFIPSGAAAVLAALTAAAAEMSVAQTVALLVGCVLLAVGSALWVYDRRINRQAAAPLLSPGTGGAWRPPADPEGLAKYLDQVNKIMESKGFGRNPQLASQAPSPDPTFRCEAIVLNDGRVDIALRSSHLASPLDDLAITRQDRRRGFEASCEVEMPEGRGTSLTPLRIGCTVGETVSWIYPDDFDARASPDAPRFPLVTGHYAVKCSWRNPSGGGTSGSSLEEAARCGFPISKTIPATSPAAKRTEVAMKVLGLAIDVLTWILSFTTAMREADGDTPGERRLRAQREQRVRDELPRFVDRLRALWPEVEPLGIAAPDTYWEPKTLSEAEAWERSLRGLVTALVRRG